MATRADILALFEELVGQLGQAGLPCSLVKLEDVPARSPLSAHRLATFGGPPGRPLDALVFEVGSELRIGFRVTNSLTGRTAHVHALQKHLTGSSGFDGSTLDGDRLAQDVRTSAAQLVTYLTANPRLLAVLNGSGWIDVPFDWAGMK